MADELLELPANALLTLEQAKAYGAGSGMTDAMLTLAIAGLSQAFELEIGYPLAAQELTETYRGTGQQTLTLARFPVVELAEVLLDGANITAECELDPATGILYREAGFPAGSWAPLGAGARNDDPAPRLVITYTAGHDPIPADLKLALVRELNSPANSGAVGIKSVQTPGGLRIAYESGELSAHTMRVLTGYKSRFCAR